MLKRLLKILIGIALLPVCVSTSIAFYRLLISLGAVGKTAAFFLAGVLSYAVMHLSSLKLNYLYVLGHETTHALLALLCGGKVRSFKVSAKRGSVATTKSNVIISLGPYFLPIYTILFTGIFFVCGLFLKQAYSYVNPFIFVVGFTVAFHFLMTIHSLRIEQPDLVGNGYLFSLTFIYIINLIMLAVLLGLVFDRASIGTFFKDAISLTKETFIFIWQTIPFEKIK